MDIQKEKIKIWVLVDDRMGNANQAIELAETIGQSFEVKKIEYNSFARLPSYLLGIFPIHIKKSVLAKLETQELPDVIISAGRRVAALALYLKKRGQTQKKIKIIQIMRPYVDSNEFDLIILPQHDNFNYTLSNVLRVIGGLTNVQEKNRKSQVEFETIYPQINNCIAVVIGGSSKGYKMTLENARLLIATIANISDNHSLPLFITFSRRTPPEVKLLIENEVLLPNIVIDPSKSNYNPYPTLLGKAEYIITTSDSISMCSEAVGTGKPVYVFCPKNFGLKKHKFFLQQLVDLGLARVLDPSSSILKKYTYQPLNEIKRVAKIIQTKGII